MGWRDCIASKELELAFLNYRSGLSLQGITTNFVHVCVCMCVIIFSLFWPSGSKYILRTLFLTLPAENHCGKFLCHKVWEPLQYVDYIITFKSIVFLFFFAQLKHK